VSQPPDICYEISLFSNLLSRCDLFLGSCKKNTHEGVKTFYYEKATGIWVPYEIIQPGCTIARGDFYCQYLFELNVVIAQFAFWRRNHSDLTAINLILDH
jgi:hypothetical protein